MTPEEQKEAALEMIRAIYDDGEAEINGQVYKFTKMTHKQRRKVFAYFTKVANSVQHNDMSFLDSDEFAKVEAVIMGSVTYNDSLLDKLGDRHWELYPGDYVPFISVALQVISYPFLPANHTA